VTSVGSAAVAAPRQHPQPHGRQPNEPELIRTALRLAFIRVAEDEAQRRLRRPLTNDELRTKLRQYPGD
jgi:hypothetical protein